MFLSVLIGSGKSRFLFFVTTKLLIVSLLTLESVPLGDPLLPLQELCGMHLISKLRVCMGPAVFSAGNVFLLLSHALDVFLASCPSVRVKCFFFCPLTRTPLALLYRSASLPHGYPCLAYSLSLRRSSVSVESVYLKTKDTYLCIFICMCVLFM